MKKKNKSVSGCYRPIVLFQFNGWPRQWCRLLSRCGVREPVDQRWLADKSIDKWSNGKGKKTTLGQWNRSAGAVFWFATRVKAKRVGRSNNATRKNVVLFILCFFLIPFLSLSLSLNIYPKYCYLEERRRTNEDQLVLRGLWLLLHHLVGLHYLLAKAVPVCLVAIVVGSWQLAADCWFFRC